MEQQQINLEELDYFPLYEKFTEEEFNQLEQSFKLETKNIKGNITISKFCNILVKLNEANDLIKDKQNQISINVMTQYMQYVSTIQNTTAYYILGQTMGIISADSQKLFANIQIYPVLIIKPQNIATLQSKLVIKNEPEKQKIIILIKFDNKWIGSIIYPKLKLAFIIGHCIEDAEEKEHLKLFFEKFFSYNFQGVFINVAEFKITIKSIQWEYISLFPKYQGQDSDFCLPIFMYQFIAFKNNDELNFLRKITITQFTFQHFKTFLLGVFYLLRKTKNLMGEQPRQSNNEHEEAENKQSKQKQKAHKPKQAENEEANNNKNQPKYAQNNSDNQEPYEYGVDAEQKQFRTRKNNINNQKQQQQHGEEQINNNNQKNKSIDEQLQLGPQYQEHKQQKQRAKQLINNHQDLEDEDEQIHENSNIAHQRQNQQNKYHQKQQQEQQQQQELPAINSRHKINDKISSREKQISRESSIETSNQLVQKNYNKKVNSEQDLDQKRRNLQNQQKQSSNRDRENEENGNDQRRLDYHNRSIDYHDLGYQNSDAQRYRKNRKEDFYNNSNHNSIDFGKQFDSEREQQLEQLMISNRANQANLKKKEKNNQEFQQSYNVNNCSNYKQRSIVDTEQIELMEQINLNLKALIREQTQLKYQVNQNNGSLNRVLEELDYYKQDLKFLHLETKEIKNWKENFQQNHIKKNIGKEESQIVNHNQQTYNQLMNQDKFHHKVFTNEKIIDFKTHHNEIQNKLEKEKKNNLAYYGKEFQSQEFQNAHQDQNRQSYKYAKMGTNEISTNQSLTLNQTEIDNLKKQKLKK